VERIETIPQAGSESSYADPTGQGSTRDTSLLLYSWTIGGATINLRLVLRSIWCKSEIFYDQQTHATAMHGVFA